MAKDKDFEFADDDFDLSKDFFSVGDVEEGDNGKITPSKYAKNLGKSAVSAGKSVLNTFLPSAVDLIDQLKIAADESVDEIKSGMNTVSDEINKKTGGKKLSDALKGWSKEVTTDIKKALTTGDFTGSSNKGFSFDSFDDFEDNVEEIVDKKNKTSKKLDSSLQYAKITTNAQMQASDNINDVNLNIFRAGAKQDAKKFVASENNADIRHTQSIGYIANIDANVEKIAGFLQTYATKSISAQMEFSQKSLMYQSDTAQILKIVAERLYTPSNDKQRTKGKSVLHSVFGSGFDGSEWGKQIRGNIKGAVANSPIGQMFSALSMLGSVNSYGPKETLGNKAMKFGAGLIPGLLLNGKTKTKLEGLNNKIGNIPRIANSKFLQMASQSDNPMLQMMGSILGVKSSSVKHVDFGVKDLNAKANFDQKFYRTVTDTIPGFLAKILAATSGEGEIYYDHKVGTFKKATQAVKEYDYAKKQAYENSSEDLTDFKKKFYGNINNLSSETGTNPADMKKDFDKIITNIVDAKEFFTPQAALSNKEYRSKLLKGVKNEANLDMFIKEFQSQDKVNGTTKEDQLKFANGVATAQGAVEKFFHETVPEMAQSGSGGQHLVNYVLDEHDDETAQNIKLRKEALEAKFIDKDKDSLQHRTAKSRLLREEEDLLRNTGRVSSAKEQKISDIGNYASGGIAKGSSQILGNIYELLLGGILVYPKKDTPDHLMKTINGYNAAKTKTSEINILKDAEEEENLNRLSKERSEEAKKSRQTKEESNDMMGSYLGKYVPGLNKFRDKVNSGVGKGTDVADEGIYRALYGGNVKHVGFGDETLLSKYEKQFKSKIQSSKDKNSAGEKISPKEDFLGWLVSSIEDLKKGAKTVKKNITDSDQYKKVTEYVDEKIKGLTPEIDPEKALEGHADRSDVFSGETMDSLKGFDKLKRKFDKAKLSLHEDLYGRAIDDKELEELIKNGNNAYRKRTSKKQAESFGEVSTIGMPGQGLDGFSGVQNVGGGGNSSSILKSIDGHVTDILTQLKSKNTKRGGTRAGEDIGTSTSVVNAIDELKKSNASYFEKIISLLHISNVNTNELVPQIKDSIDELADYIHTPEQFEKAMKKRGGKRRSTGILGGVAGGIGGGLKGAIGGIGKFYGKAFSGFGSLVKGTFKLGAGVLGNKSLHKGIGGAVGGIGSLVGGIAGGIGSLYGGLLKGIGNFFGGGGKGGAGSLGKGIGAAGGGLGAGLGSLFKGLGAGGGAMAKGFGKIFQGYGTGLGSIAGGLGSRIGGFIGGKKGKRTSNGMIDFENPNDTMTAILEEIRAIRMKLVGKGDISNKLRKGSADIADNVKKTAGAVGGFISDKFNKLKGKLPTSDDVKYQAWLAKNAAGDMITNVKDGSASNKLKVKLPTSDDVKYQAWLAKNAAGDMITNVKDGSASKKLGSMIENTKDKAQKIREDIEKRAGQEKKNLEESMNREGGFKDHIKDEAVKAKETLEKKSSEAMVSISELFKKLIKDKKKDAKENAKITADVLDKSKVGKNIDSIKESTHELVVEGALGGVGGKLGKVGKILKYGRLGVGVAAGAASVAAIGYGAMKLADKNELNEKSGLNKTGTLKDKAAAFGGVSGSSSYGYDGKALTESQKSSQSTSITKLRMTTVKILKKGLQVGAKSAKGLVKAGMEDGGKFIGFIKGLLGKVLKSGPAKKFANEKTLKAVETAAGDILKPSLIERMGKAGIIAKIIGKFAGPLSLALTVNDFVTGLNSTNRYYGLGAGAKPTFTMQLTSGIANVFSSLLMGILPTSTIIQFLEKHLAGKAEQAYVEGFKKFTEAKAKILGVEAKRLQEFETQNIWDRLFGSAKNNSKLLGFKTVEEFNDWLNHIYKPVEEIRKRMARAFGGDMTGEEPHNMSQAEKIEKFRETFLRAAADYVGKVKGTLKSNKDASKLSSKEEGPKKPEKEGDHMSVSANMINHDSSGVAASAAAAGAATTTVGFSGSSTSLMKPTSKPFTPPATSKVAMQSKKELKAGSKEMDAINKSVGIPAAGKLSGDNTLLKEVGKVTGAGAASATGAKLAKGTGNISTNVNTKPTTSDNKLAGSPVAGSMNAMSANINTELDALRSLYFEQTRHNNVSESMLSKLTELVTILVDNSKASYDSQKSLAEINAKQLLSQIDPKFRNKMGLKDDTQEGGEEKEDFFSKAEDAVKGFFGMKPTPNNTPDAVSGADRSLSASTYSLGKGGGGSAPSQESGDLYLSGNDDIVLGAGGSSAAATTGSGGNPADMGNGASGGSGKSDTDATINAYKQQNPVQSPNMNSKDLAKYITESITGSNATHELYKKDIPIVFNGRTIGKENTYVPKKTEYGVRNGDSFVVRSFANGDKEYAVDNTLMDSDRGLKIANTGKFKQGQKAVVIRENAPGKAGAAPAKNGNTDTQSAARVISHGGKTNK